MMIADMIRQGESKTLEFKAEFPQKNQIAKTVCAFANRAGGYIIIGINDNGDVIGVEKDLIADYIDRIANIIHDSVFPMVLPEIYTYKISNKMVIIIRVFIGNTPPYYLKSDGRLKGTYLRVGKSNKLADRDMIRELERVSLKLTYDTDFYKPFNNEELNQLTDILEKPFERIIPKSELQKFGLISDNGSELYFTNAASIILGKGEHCKINCARFLGDSVVDFFDKKEFSGDIFSQIEGVIGFFKNHLNIAGIITGSGLKRNDSLEIPEEVLREAIINAVIHRDYSILGASIKVAIFNSSIEITSPGGLIRTITVEEIYQGLSEVRNSALAKVFAEAGLIELWGSGIPRIREMCAKIGLQEPELCEAGLFVRLTIYRRGDKVYVQEVGEKYNSDISKTTLVNREMEQIQSILKEDGTLTVKEISDRLGISVAAVQRRLESLQKMKRIKRVGSKKTGWWRV